MREGKASAGASSKAMLENVELDEASKRELLELEAKVGAVDLFTLLGVEKEAPPAEVKKAFYQLCRRLHPDRFFRKRLGSFKVRIDRVFEALSRAHQTLVDPVARDAYLEANPAARKPPPAPKRVRGRRMVWNKDDLPAIVTGGAEKKGK